MGEIITLPGKIDEQGELRINMEQLRQEIKKYRNCNVAVNIEVFDGGDVEVMRAWYGNYVLPRVVTAWRILGENYTAEQADRELVKLTTVRQATALEEVWIIPLENLDRPELIRYLDEVKYICSTNLSLSL